MINPLEVSDMRWTKTQILRSIHNTDVRNWFSNIEQHASEGVNKILIGNKCDMEDKRVSIFFSLQFSDSISFLYSLSLRVKVVSAEQGQTLANELNIRFMETSAKANIGVEEAFFDLAR